ncbi:tetratricopeptide repeat protein [Flavobacterium sp. HSC-61S13]|uniref:tetratricopeptide repeat-containing sensor histidine kinase n=1 Tax=Flavobacterium sp. HSC-61S13 TaxID=2910963 RepID=UPI0020A1972E|nr:tetratricopeptide repeat protein [Flavobacterium sp. HSC-61S13]MCP1997544.1 signal transduction histidine kinase [Flavobacterium sp. HSC-61S13]
MKKEILVFLLVLLCSLTLFISCKKETTTTSSIANKTAYFNQNKAEEYINQSINDSAYYYYLESNRELLVLKDSANFTYNSIRISEIQLFSGDISGAESTCTEAIKYVPADKKYYLIALYNNIGRCYRQLYDYDKAIEYYTKALKIETDELSKLILKNNIGYNYLKNSQFSKAIHILDSLIQSPILKQNPIHYARSLDNLGISQFKMDANEGLPNLLQALHIRDSLNYEHGLVESYSNLSEYYIQRNASSAREYAMKMYELAQKLKNRDDELEALSLLLQSSSPSELRTWSEKYITLSNSIAKTTQTAKNQFAKIKYDHQKETAENLELKTKTTKQELDIQKETNRRQILVFILITVVVGVFWFIKNSRRRHKEEKAKQVYLTETKISKKIHDELANDIYNIIAFTENFDVTTDHHKNRLLNELENTYNKTRNISSEYGAISFGDDFSNYLKGILQEYNGKQVKIVSVGIDSIDWNLLTEVKKIALYRVIQELLVNMKKHSQATMVSFKFEYQKRHLKISYSDNGTGIVNEKLIAKNGLTNAENRIRDIQGSFIFEIEINKGMKIFITIPL